MLDGETERDNFVVIEKVTGNRLAYQGISAKSIPTYIKLDPDQSISSKLIHLDSIYSFEHNTAYEVYYMSTLTYISCDESVEFSGFIESNHINIFN